MIDTIILDFDGTVMDTNEVIIQSWQNTFKTLTGSEGDIDYILSTFGEPLEDSMRKTFPSVPVDEAVDVYRRWHRENFIAMINLFPGILEMLDELKVAGYKLGIATSRVKTTLYQGLAKYDLEKYFDGIVTVEEVTKHKPEPESVLKVLDKLESKPENAIMVGDTKFDILCAHNAGVKAVLVGWSVSLQGKTMQDFAKEEAPDYIISKPEELLDIVKA